ncbi:pseudaminic acid synthase [Marinobacter sp. LV10MA510-1]|uniref:pseudaminic acid synthase n=1 Tax=Marinobacter sp. LV10MA510-1 TaxID=1415567 RepID=UPI000BF4765E|nr:pseudaminic acid synthase [Marinobacter sp. LV10MA510-1]PFG11732.1 N-acetylneuraminate synthase [Marinobacter sp. LV10MA510-1]
MSIIINGVKIGPGQPPYIVAELSANHNGSLEHALATISEAKRCGANAVKLQTYTADTMTIDSNRHEFLIQGGPWEGYKLYDLYRWAQTPFEWHPALFAHARKLGITIFSTPFDESAVDLLESLDAPAYKIASFELTDLPLIEYVARTGKPMIMSTGMASEQEIEDAVVTAKTGGCSELILLHCVSSYPAPFEQANLAQISELTRRFKTVSGLSDHTLGTTASVAAVALGAHFIEKHFTLNRDNGGPDSSFSIEPDELERLCIEARNAWLSVGKADYSRQQCEEPNRAFRRSIYFVNDKKAGDKVNEPDVKRIRPGLGLEPKYFGSLIGRTLKKDVDKGTPTSWEHFDE